MPSIRLLARRAGISPNVFRTIVNDCIPSHCSQYIPHVPISSSDTYISVSSDAQASLIQIVQHHYNAHRIHRRGLRNRSNDVPLRINPTLADFLNESRVATPSDLSDERGIGIGCDPEFEVWNHEANSQERFRHGDSSSTVGVDGDGVTGELRPQWSRDPVKVFQTIDSLMNTVAEHVSTNCSVVAGEGKFKSTGGHIHISGLGDSPPGDLITALDTFIARPLSDRCNGYRKNSGYNGLSLWRRQQNRFEYRSPASWLAHPVLTKGALVIASVLSNEQKLSHTLPSTNNDLLDSAPNAEERSAIEMFYLFLSNLEAQGKFLEELDVLRVWGKRKINNSRSSANNDNRTFLVRCGNDTNIPQDLYWHRDPEVTFVGASISRGEDNIIFLPRRFNLFTHAIVSIFPSYTILGWDLSAIGLSVSLREDETRVRTTIESILRVVAP